MRTPRGPNVCSTLHSRRILPSATLVRCHHLFCDSTNTHLPQIWETESAGIFNLTECVEKGEIKCAQYWPDGIGETEEFILGDKSTIFVTRIDKDPLQDIIDDIEEGLDNELKSSKARETTKFRNAISDKKKFEIRTFELACIPREITKGLKVKVKDPSQPDVNGRVGVAKDQNEDKSRWNVEFKGKDGGKTTTVALKPNNLETEMVPCPRGAKCNDLNARCGRDRYPASVSAAGSRVRLSDGAYINANYIRYPDYVLRRSGRNERQTEGDVIATQGPLSGTEGEKIVKGKTVKGKTVKGKKKPDKVEPDKVVKGKYEWPEGHSVSKEFAKDDWEFKDTRPQFWQMVRVM